jgi:hypothetical protein
MTHNSGPEAYINKPVSYQIRVKGLLGDQWSAWFEGLAIKQEEDGNTTLTGPIVDDAALHGYLKKVRDLGMSLLSVNRVEISQAEAKENMA